MSIDTKLNNYVGVAYTEKVHDTIKRELKIDKLRAMKPGFEISLDWFEDRLNVDVNKEGNIAGFYFG